MADIINLISFQEVLAYVQNGGYAIVFILMIIGGGPIIIYASAFLASQGIFDIYVIFLLAILGNLVSDTTLFFIGKRSRIKSIEKIFYYFGFNRQRIEKMEKGFSNQSVKTITVLKLIPGLDIGLMLAGFSNMPFRKFFTTTSIFNVSAAVVFTLLGFYSGIRITSLLRYLKLEKYILITLIIFVLIIYLLGRLLDKELKII